MFLYVGGGVIGQRGNMAWFVSGGCSRRQLALTHQSNAEESDTRIWLHVSQSSMQRFYIFSPDTDVYHIGLPLDNAEKDILIEINAVGTNQKRILSLSNLKHNLINDPDLASVPPELLPQVIQTLYVVTGSDYTSFFSGFGKISFMKCFFQHAEFITGGGKYTGSFALGMEKAFYHSYDWLGLRTSRNMHQRSMPPLHSHTTLNFLNQIDTCQ